MTPGTQDRREPAPHNFNALQLKMNNPSPLPAGLKWVMRILGGLLIAGSLLTLPFTVNAIWTARHQIFGPGSGSLKDQQMMQLLGVLTGRLVGHLALFLVGVWLLRRSGKAMRAAAPALSAKTESSESPAVHLAKAASRASGKRWHSCNVLKVGAEARQLWQFDARNGGFVLNREQTSFEGEPLPAHIVNKDWRALWQPKLNVAWLAPEHVFLRVVQLPRSDVAETLSMVDLQMEKLSPMPVAQVVWSIQVLEHAEANLQTVIVMVVARNVVEEFLGQLEGQGYLADRLELPLLDQLQATIITGDGAWIYPDDSGTRSSGLAAWWYGGVLQHLDLVTLPVANRSESLKEQLLQMAWAGEMEGWLSSPPRWHLVADSPTAAEWGPALRQGLDQPIEVVAPLSSPDLAALTAKRAAHAEPKSNLLPAEFSTRYQQQFVDRLWMRALLGLAGFYMVAVIIYGVAVSFATFRVKGVEREIAKIAPTYTNALQFKARYQVLADRKELQFAALDCWKLVARHMPESLTLEGLNFSEGRKLTLNGTAPADRAPQITDFFEAMRKSPAPSKDSQQLQLMFDPSKGDQSPKYNLNPGGNTYRWDFSLELKRVEIQ
jgi:hypothetical protein